MTELIYCLQSKTKWVDGDSWWTTQSRLANMDDLLNNSLPILKQHDREAKANSTIIEGFEYRIVMEIIMLGGL